MKLIAKALVPLALIGASAVPAAAQIPTVDVAAIAENVKTVAELEKQLTALRDMENMMKGIAELDVLGGANVELYREVMERYPHLHVITSGGVGTLDDVRELKALEPHGVIVGKALYENRFTVAEAIAC